MKKINRRIQLELEVQIKIDLAGFLVFPAGWQGEQHSHRFWELVYIESGNGVLSYLKKSYGFKPGDLFLFKPKSRHQFRSNKTDLIRMFYLGFSFKIVPPSAEQDTLFLLPDVPSKVVKNIFMKICKEADASFDTEKLLKNYYFELLETVLKVVNLIKIYSDQVHENFPCKNAQLADETKQFLNENVDKNISVRKLASRVHLSPHYFGDIFKKETGMSLKQYHDMIKMEKAMNLLKHGNLSVSEISNELGYKSPEYFTRRFKNYYKQPPSFFLKKSAKSVD